MATGSSSERSLEQTPTWAVALVCAVFVIISVIIEHVIHSIGKWFQKKQKKAMLEALEKIKAELMLLGFLSLLLTVGTKYVAKICVPDSIGYKMLPCKAEHYDDDDDGKKKDGGKGGDGGDGDDEHRRKLLFLAEDVIFRRVLAAAKKDGATCEKGMVPMISYSAVHQLHIFIFILAVFHILYSVIIIVLGLAKMKKWKAWEAETKSLEYEFTNDPARFRFAHQTSFVRRHTGLSTKPGIRWVVAFFRQFFGSISKVDYLTIRNGFINAHFAPNSKFDFHKYIKRSMEDDFKFVLGISIPLWMFSILFLLLNVHKWHALTYLSFVPLLILLLVGTKLELVIMEMAQQIQDKATIVRGAPVVEPSNKFFWFNSPKLVLFLIHFTLFQNAFQMAFFLWTVYEFGINSCYHESILAIGIRVGLGVLLHVMCSYITFPLYALVTQMGSHMKRSIFEEQTSKALKKWQKAAKERRRLRELGDSGGRPDTSNSGIMSMENTPSRGSSPVHFLHNNKHRSSTAESEIDIPSSPRAFPSETELSDTEGPYHARDQHKNLHPNFSFPKS
ncbi:MLO protein homolog 1-like [Cynara cardunculus var. scolymus]|uniref:MLO protein homolog 1-like n=1 Tax=Cynara cardunculus var. scolymus TaxID=59895 RepID=UPI000D62D681|nr:MLO protein homolog 1-like [Cynara cardunculus var. scolymus]